jgi:uncharacterized protein (UPF0548 family)
MFLLREPSDKEIRRFILAQSELHFSYPEVGATRGTIPARYNVDHNRVKLGVGRGVYERAISALRSWKHFDLGWVRIVNSGTQVEEDATVAVLARLVGFWSLNACRIVYLINDTTKFGFAYGTLPEHVECGEECFTIEWCSNDDSVWYDILAFSRPNKFSAKIGYPLARLLQRRFARDSLRAMARASSMIGATQHAAD